MQQLTERQKDAAQRIYDVMIRFLEEYSNTDGFSSWRAEFREKGSRFPEDEVFERITEMQERVNLVLNQEYFDLHDHEIYDALCAFAGEGLTAVYRGKIGPGEQTGADGAAVWQEYEKALQRLNEIIERYV